MKDKAHQQQHIQPRRSADSRNKHFLSIWLEDPDIKSQLKKAAKDEGRSLNNFVNTYVIPEVEAVLLAKAKSSKVTKMPSDEELRRQFIRDMARRKEA